MKNKVVGIYGMMCSGKDTVASLLKEKGFTQVSVSEDVLKPILKTMKLTVDRLNYIKLGRVLKGFKGDSLAFLVHGLMNKGVGHKYVIPNIMTFQEANYFKKQEDIDFTLIMVTANQQLRYERGLQRKSEKDVYDLATFRQLDLKNLNNTGLKELMHAGLADIELNNEGTIKELRDQLNKIL